MNVDNWDVREPFADIKKVTARIRTRLDQLDAIMDVAPPLMSIILVGHGLLAASVEADAQLERLLRRIVRAVDAYNRTVE